MPLKTAVSITDTCVIAACVSFYHICSTAKVNISKESTPTDQGKDGGWAGGVRQAIRARERGRGRAGEENPHCSSWCNVCPVARNLSLVLEYENGQRGPAGVASHQAMP